MPVTNYYTVEGEIIGEKTTGNSRMDYLTDALGSVTATVNQSAQVANTYRYNPYGSQLSKTGVDADPAFQWVGTLGYRQTGKKYSDMYVRARHYSSISGTWTTPDPIKWRGGWNYYGYVRQRPTVRTDPSGLTDPLSCTVCAAALVGVFGILLECANDSRGFGTCLCGLMEEAPWLMPLLMGTAYISCTICMPGLAAVLTPAEGALAGGAVVTGPCMPPSTIPTCPGGPTGGGDWGPEGPPENPTQPPPVEIPGEPGDEDPEDPGDEDQPRVPPPIIKEDPDGPDDCEGLYKKCVDEGWNKTIHECWECRNTCNNGTTNPPNKWPKEKCHPKEGPNRPPKKTHWIF